MADGYGLITSDADVEKEMKRRQEAAAAARKVAYEASPEGQRKAEITRREAELINEARQQASRKERTNREYDRQLSHPRTRQPKTINVDGEDTPINEAIAKIPSQMDFEQRVLASPLRDRALRRSRIEELVADGKSQADAEQQALTEQQNRKAAFARGKSAIESEGSNPGKETRALFESTVGGLTAPVARMLGFEDAANQQEARSAGVQAGMAQHRQETYAHPEIAGAVAGAAQNVAQMGPGIAASMIATPGAGMAVMAGQFGTQEYSRAAYEGAEAGLAGNELKMYAGIQGGIEASIMPIMSKIPGLAGIEGRVLRQTIAKNVATNPSVMKIIAGGAKTMAKDTASELVEEILTETLHGVATEKLLNEDVDYKAVLKDTTLQTLIMMGMTEGIQQTGRLATSGEQRTPVPATQQPAEDPSSFTQTPIDEMVTAREAAAGSQATPVPEIESFKAKPSRKTYEAAVAAGMPPITKPDGTPNLKPNEKDRKQYAASDLLSDPFGMRKPDLSGSSPPPDPATPPAATPDPASLEPVSRYDKILNLLQKGDPNEQVQASQDASEAQGNQVAGANGTQGQEGRQELLSDVPAGTQDPAPPVEVKDSQQPAAHTDREAFEKEYRDTYKKMMEYTPDQAGSKYYADKMADLWDANPDWADEIENQKTPPVASPGEASPDQSPSPPAIDPDSFEEPDSITYHSGLSRSPADVDEATKTNTPVGVSVFSSLSSPMRKRLVDYANADGKVFVDSGAFTAFKKGKELDWDKTLFAYHELLSSITPDKRNNMTIVAPDIVGDHQATMNLQFDLLDKFTPIIELGGRVIVPVQKENGGGNLWKHWADATNSFDEKQNENFIVGVPFNEAAWSQDDVLKFMRKRDKDVEVFGGEPRPFHLLGAGPGKIQRLFDAAKAEGLSIVGVSADAMPRKISVRKNPRKGQAPSTPPVQQPPVEEPVPYKPMAQRIRDEILEMAKPTLDQTTESGALELLKLAARRVWRRSLNNKGDDPQLRDSKDWFNRDSDEFATRVNEYRKRQAKSTAKSSEAKDRSLRSLVLNQGGISTKSLQSDYDQKDLKSDGLLGVMRITGQPLDEIAQILEASGDLRVPEGRTAADYLLEQLKLNADGARAQYSDVEIEAQLEKEREQYERLQETLKAEGIDDAGLEELRKNSIEAGFDAGEEISDEQADEIIDTSFNFGANVEAKTDDEEFTLQRPKAPKKAPKDFGSNPNTKQGGLFDAGKKDELPGQNLLFNSDPGDLDNPRTQENKVKQPANPLDNYKAMKRKNPGAMLLFKIGDFYELYHDDASNAAPVLGVKLATRKSKNIDPVQMAGFPYHELDKNLNRLIKAGFRVAIIDGNETPPAQSQSEPSQEDLMEAILREELLGEKPKKERKPRAPKLGERVTNPDGSYFNKPPEPKASKTPRSDAAKKRKERTSAELKAAEDAVFKAFNATPNTGLNPEQMRATAQLVKAALNDKVSTFNEFVAYVLDTFGEPLALRMAEGIELAWTALKRLPGYSGIDDAGKVADIIGKKTGWDAVSGHFANQLANGKSYKSITEARSEAGEIIGAPVKPGTADAKTLDEAIEYGIVQAGRMIVEAGGTPGAIYDKLVDMYSRQPVLGVRNSKSMILQAYSTPVPLAWLVSNLGNVTSDTTVYEPTAGNGMLLIGTDVKNAFANELDPDRAKILRDQGFNVTENDAANTASPEVDVVLANPPFGKVKDADRKTIEFDVDGFKTTEIDHAIALQSLKGMKPDGHTVLILAAKGHDAKTDLERRTAYSKGKDRPFYDALYQGYDVTQHFTVDGSLYSRQGASFPVDVIVLRPRGTVSVDQKRATPWAVVPRIFNNWGDLKNAFFNDLADSGSGTGVLSGNGNNGSSDLSTRNTDDVGRIPGSNENTTSMVEGDVNASESKPVVSTPVDGKTGSRGSRKKSGGSRSQSGLSNVAANERGGKGNVSATSEAGTVSGGLDSGTRPDGMAGTSTAESEIDPESHQSVYESASKNKSVDTLIPTNLQDAARLALESVEDAYGPIDAFVQKELGYDKNDQFFKDLSAEQVDAIALAIHSHKRGGGMIVGDMTGVGKGRVAAAMMRYADRQGLVPVFVTEKPDLFGDMYRDLADIGSDTPESPFLAQTTNDTSGSKSIDLPNGRKLQTSKETNLTRFDEGLASLKAGNGFKVMIDGVPTKVNAIFTMYSQLQTVKGAETRRRQQLRELMPHAYLIMDESHNAGGTVKERVDENAPPDRAAYAREIVQSASGVMYLSATFAKRPDVMDLYSKTDMAKAVDGDITKLADVIKTGGLPLQQVVSAMLGEVGQYIRREKSFDGIEFAKVDVGVNLDEQDKITDIFRNIRSLDAVIAKVVADMQDEMVAAGESGVAGDISTGDAGLTSTSFSSILWNAVDQMLFALKADKAADNAIEAWKNGEVPILAVDNTMESILDEYVKENQLKVGDVVNLSFKDILQRYLERSRWITVDTGMRDARNKKITRKERLTDEQLNVETELGNALTMFNMVTDAISATNIEAPASPIDWLRYRMQKAGMRIAEVTGRKTILLYSDNGTATLAARPKSEYGTRGKQETIRRINDGSLDGMILNRSGSTGLSVHASEKFRNQKIRHMMIVQPAKNIDEFMQMLGRVNRTGQVVKPRYSLLMSDSPAELRPAAVLSKKLASLNASVTAKSKGAVGFTVTDVMNEVGGAIVSQYLVENPEFAMSLDMEMEELNEDTESDTLEDVVRKATGRSAILPIAQQREFWDDITAAYNSRIEELNALNANPLIAQTMDLDARTLSSVNLFAGKPDDGPFAAPANIERMDVRNPGKPMTPSQVTGKIKEFYDITSMDERHGAAIKWERDTASSLQEEMPAFHAYAVKNLVNPEAVIARHTKLHEQTEVVIEAINKFAPGTVIEYVLDGMPFSGVVIGFKRTGRTGNPSAPSRWVIEIAINDSARKLNVPVSRSSNLFVKNESIDSVLKSFEYAQTQSRERRWMGTGNLVAAYAQLSARNGKLIFYTDDQGNTKRGILMPRAFDATSFLEGKAVQFQKADDILTFFDRGGTRIVSADSWLVIVKTDDKLVLQAPRARQRGGKYTLNQGIIAAAQQDFVSVANLMYLRSSNREQQRRILDAVLNVTTLEARNDTDRDLARSILGITNKETPAGSDSDVAEGESPYSSAGSAEAPISEARQAANEAKAAVDARKAENAKLSADVLKALRGTPAGAIAPISGELAKAVAKRMFGELELGVRRFDAFVKALRADLDDANVRSMKDLLIFTWNAIREDDPSLFAATEAEFESAMESATDSIVKQAIEAAKAETEVTPAESQDQSPAAESQNREPAIADPSTPTPDPATRPAATGDDRTYSTKLAATDAERERLGMGKRAAKARQSREDSINLAAKIGKTEYGRTKIDALIGELSVRPRATTPLENDMLNFRYAELDQKYEDALNQQIEGRANGDDAQQAIGEREAENNLNQMKELIEITEGGVSYALGAGLQARKAAIRRDFTMARMVLEYEAAFGRKLDPATPTDKAILDDMQAKIDDLNTTNERLRKLLDEAAEDIESLEARLKEAHSEKVRKARETKEPKAPAEPKPPKTEADKTRRDKALEKINNARKKFRSLLTLNRANSVGGALYTVTEAALEMATGYAELGVVNLADFLTRAKRTIGPEAKNFIAELTAAWRTVSPTDAEIDTSSITDRIDPFDADSVGRAARSLHAFVIQRDGLDATPEGRDAAVAAVHEILKEFVTGLTPEETARAMSGIGIYSELSDNDIEVIRRDQKAQLLLLEQISDWKQGTPPPATGQERPPVSDEQRALRKAVNEAKKESGIDTTTEGQLRSALDAAKRMLRNRIADLNKAIKSGDRITRSKKVLEDPSGELKALQDERDALQRRYNEAFGKNKLTDEQRMIAAEKALDRAIANLESDLEAGKLYPDPAPDRLTSPAIEAKRAALKALKASRDEMRMKSGEAQARSDAAYERHLLEREAELSKRLAENDFKPAEKKPTRVHTPEMLKLMLSIQKKQQELLKMRRDWEFQNRHIVYRAFKKGPVATAHVVRKALTTLDQSLIGRQGYLLGITHPKIYAQATRKAFASNPFEARSIFPTEQDLFNTQAELDADDNWVRLEKIAKLAITDVHGGINREEGNQFVPGWFDKIWGIGASERAGSAFINTQRRLVFRSLVEKLARTIDGKRSVSNSELRVIGNLVNVASGRGSLGKWANSLEALTVVFFSPRWWMSRLAWWSGQPVWHDSRWFGGEGASWDVRKLAAVEWAKQAAAQALVMGVVISALKAAFGDPGEDEEWDWYGDPRNPDFGRIRIGKTPIDMTAGLGQHLALFARLFTGKQVNRWETTDVDALSLLGAHERGKLAPIPSAIVDYFAGKSISGEITGSKEWWLGHVEPLISQDVRQATSKEGIPLGSVLSLLMFFGIGAQTRDQRIKERKDIANELRAMEKQKADPEKIKTVLNEHLAHAASLEAKEKLRTANPDEVEALESVVDKRESPALVAAIQKEKYDIALRALQILSTEDKKKTKSTDDDAGINTARQLLRTIAPTYDEANELFSEAYKHRNGRLAELVGPAGSKRFVVKEGVRNARQRLKAMYK